MNRREKLTAMHSISFTPTMFAKIKKTAKRFDVSISEVVRQCMAKPKFWFIIVLLIVAAIGVISIFTWKSAVPTSHVNAEQHSPDLRDTKGFLWFKDWNELNLRAVKNFYQRYTVADMHRLWHEKLCYKYGNTVNRADTFYPWDGYIAQLLELGHPFLDFSDYESALETRMCILTPARTYWRTLNTLEREAYLNTQGLPPDTSWETYQAYLIKQRVVYRINWWRSGGMDPF